eukprot:c12838_g1_i1 orf=65-1573(+)
MSPHALLLPYPMQGHINPFMELGKRLASLGLRVTLVTTTHVHAKIVRAQRASPHPISKRHVNFTLIGVPDGLPTLFNRDLITKELSQAIDGNLEDRVLELVHTLASQGHPVTCIVADFFLHWTPSLARRTCLPEFVLWPQCASVFSIFFHMDVLISAGYDPFDTSDTLAPRPDPMDIVSCIPGLPPHIRYADLPFDGPLWTLGKEWQRKLLRIRFSHLGEAQGLIMNSFEALEPEVCKALTGELQQLIMDAPNISPRRLQFVGPLMPLEGEGSGASLWEEEVEECKRWLDRQPPLSVVLVAFGSMAMMTCIKQAQELARGLSASGQRFLWVFRKDSIKHAHQEDPIKHVELEDALPHGFLEKTKDVGKVVRWAPQAWVLSHPSIGGFFSHCGWNSILESINFGVPILAWPSFMDQITNTRLVSHVWKMGLALECDANNQTTRDAIEKGVRELMEGPHSKDMRACAIKLKKLAKEDVRSSHQLLSFVNDIYKLATMTSSKGFV